MATILKVIVSIFCMAHHALAMSDAMEKQVKALVSHVSHANDYFESTYEHLASDFPWLRKSKAAHSMVAESISTMSEACSTSCGFGKTYHQAMCAVKGYKVFPLIYGPLLLKGESDQGLCDKVKEDPDSFYDLCMKHCRTNTQIAMLTISNEAQRMIDGESPDSLSAEEDEEENDLFSPFQVPGESRLYAVDDEAVDHSEFMDKIDNKPKLPTWAIVVMIASFVSLFGMGRAIYSLKKRLAVAEALRPGSVGYLHCEEQQLE